MTVSRRRIALYGAIFGVPQLVLLGVAWRVYTHYRIEVPPRLGPEARVEVMRVARAALETGASERPDHPQLERALAHGGPAVISVWLDGRPVARADGFGDRVADAVAAAAAELAAHPNVERLNRVPVEAQRARLKVDIAVGRGPIATGFRRPVSLNPGKEGLGVVLDADRVLTLMPDDLVSLRLLSVEQPISFIRDFKVGLDFQRADTVFARYAGLPPGGYGQAHRRYFRFRTDSFVDRPADERDQEPLPLVRGLPPGPEVTADNLRRAAIAGGRYLVAHLAPNGRYQYQVDLASGRGTDPNVIGPYSIPRHAGTTYFLAELYRHTGEEFLREPIERAFAHLVELVEAGGCTGTLPSGAPFACVVDKGQTHASLGSTALGLVALAEYRRATDDPRYDTLMRDLAEWVLFMQRDDGSFRHLYDIPNARPDEQRMSLYFSGEAALAMARMYTVTGDERYLRATEAALDWLVDWYDFFVGGFFVGEEHWTCIASEAIWPALEHDRYRVFCDHYGEFLRMQQPIEGENPGQDDLAGSYGFTPFMVPNNTPVGSRTEAMLSAYLLGKHHGKANPAIRGQILRAMKYALRQQIREANAWAVPNEVRGLGALTASGIDRTVRIDYVQHVCSAMIRTAALLDEEAASP